MSGMAEDTVVKFCTYVGYVKSQHKNDKDDRLPPNWHGHGHMTHFFLLCAD